MSESAQSEIPNREIMRTNVRVMQPGQSNTRTSPACDPKNPCKGRQCKSSAQTLSPMGDSEAQLSCLGTPRCFRALQARIPYASGCYGNAKRKSLDSHRKVKTKSELAGPLLSSTAATRRPDNFTAHNINSTSSHYGWGTLQHASVDIHSLYLHSLQYSSTVLKVADSLV